MLFAVLIDAENTPATAAEAIIDEVSGLGELAVRRIYGDFTSTHLKDWASKAPQLALLPYHQPANTTGKNSSDIALVIDAMDLLHSGRFDGFVLVSSDSDFTRLASRIREHGKFVCGVGRESTPDPFRQACQKFVLIENLASPTEAGEEKVQKKPSNHAFQLISNVLKGADTEDGWIKMGQLGSSLTQRYPDFDSRSYGFDKLSRLVADLDKLEVRGQGGSLSVRLT